MMRDLTDQEVKAMALLKALESAIDSRRITVKLTMGPKAIEIASKIPGLEILRSEFSEESKMWTVVFLTSECAKYVDFAVGQLGISQYLDGSLLTHDNMLIPNDYLG